jgi:hypothetical protein
MALSELFIIDDEDKAEDGADASTRADQEQLIERIHTGGAVGSDLDVIFWDEPTRLAMTLIEAVEAKMGGQLRAAAGRPIRFGARRWKAIQPPTRSSHRTEARLALSTASPFSTRSFRFATVRNRTPSGPIRLRRARS